MSNLRTACLITSLLLLSFSSRAFAQTPRQIAEKTFPSVVLVVMEDSHAQPFSLGSGFFVRPDVIATNFHVVEGAANGHVKLVGQKTLFVIDGVVAVDLERDLILLHVSGANAPPLSVGDSAAVGVGDAVYVVGNPEGLEGTFSDGLVSGIRKIPQGSLIQVTAPISPGSSGGPVLDARGAVIGIAESTFREGQNLNFAVPATELTPLLQSTKSSTSLASVSHAKPTATATNLYGGKGSEGIVGDAFAWGSSEFGGLHPSFSFSLRNRLRTPVSTVEYLVIFYDATGNPIEVQDGRYGQLFMDESPIPASLAKRVSSTTDESVRRLTTRVVIRILDFTAASDQPHEDSAAQQKCDDQAPLFARYQRQQYGKVPLKNGYVTQYDARANRCYVETAIDFGDGRDPASMGRSGLPYSGESYEIGDAFIEGDASPIYGEFFFHQDGVAVPGGECKIYPQGGTLDNNFLPVIKCRSEEEFNGLALKYFGIAQPAKPTIPANSPKW